MMECFNKLLLMMASFFAICSVYAQEDYSFLSLPAELTKKANAVVRNSITTYEIENEGRFVMNQKYAITILNAAGDKHAAFEIWYDKLSKVREIKGSLYNAFGKKIKSVKKGDINDVSGTSSMNLADDNRVKLHNFNYQVYPYTIEYETSTSFEGLFYFPPWIPVEAEYLSIQHSSLQVIADKSFDLRFKAFNYLNGPVITEAKNEKWYRWELNNFNAIESEVYSVAWYEFTPCVFLAPRNFELQKYKGSMQDWKSLGLFLYKLNEGRQELPAAIKKSVHDLTDTIHDPKEKIRILYEFLQRTTRYISIQLGIGGWQTFDASYVASNGYGDCKALSNYMYSLLREAGIRSQYALIKAGRNNRWFIEDFPSNQFNHVILCVPGKGDTTWLECTSQTEASGYLGSFTSKRNALVIDENGGTLTRTPEYSNWDNLQQRAIQSVLNNNGNLDMVVSTTFRAEQQDEVHGLINAYSKEKVSDHLKEKLDLPSYELLNFNYRQVKGKLPTILETLEVKANNYATITGKRLFINPNVLNRSGTRLPDQSKRKLPLQLEAAYVDIDSVTINIGTDYIPESSMEPITLISKFGSYTASYQFHEGKILYVRRMERISGRFEASDALSLKAFLDSVYRNDRVKLVFVKKQ
jgi:hypothetical protein